MEGCHLVPEITCFDSGNAGSAEVCLLAAGTALIGTGTGTSYQPSLFFIRFFGLVIAFGVGGLWAVFALDEP